MYDIKKRKDGWAVVDTNSDAVVIINGVLQVALDVEDADDLADCLNYIQSQKPERLH